MNVIERFNIHAQKDGRTDVIELMLFKKKVLKSKAISLSLKILIYEAASILSCSAHLKFRPQKTIEYILFYFTQSPGKLVYLPERVLQL